MANKLDEDDEESISSDKIKSISSREEERSENSTGCDK